MRAYMLFLITTVRPVIIGKIMRKRLLTLVFPALVIAASSNASTIQFDDLTETLAVTVDGQVVTANQGRITNFMLGFESVSFDISTNGNAFISASGYTNLLYPLNNDGQVGSVSDRFIFTTTSGAMTYHVSFGSDTGTLPAIPNGAIDLTTVPDELLPPNPYYENSTFQKVGSVFSAPDVALDTYFVRSALTGIPEPSSLALLGAGLLLLTARRRR